MAKFSLSRPDAQARFSAILSLISCVCLAGLALLVFRHVDSKEWVITYGRTRGQLVMAAAGITILLAVIAFGMGWSSAGQRRNDKPALSWLGFFVSAGVICLAVVIFFLFRNRGEMVVTF